MTVNTVGGGKGQGHGRGGVEREFVVVDVKVVKYVEAWGLQRQDSQH